MEGDGELTFGMLPQSLQGKARGEVSHGTGKKISAPSLCPQLGNGWRGTGGPQHLGGQRQCPVADG